MKKVKVPYIIGVSVHELDRDMVESYKDKTFNSLEELRDDMRVDEIDFYTLDEFIDGINDESLDVLTEWWVTKVYILENEKRFNVLDSNENVVKTNVNQDGVDRYLQGKDSSLYLLEEIK